MSDQEYEKFIRGFKDLKMSNQHHHFLHQILNVIEGKYSLIEKPKCPIVNEKSNEEEPAAI